MRFAMKPQLNFAATVEIRRPAGTGLTQIR